MQNYLEGKRNKMKHLYWQNEKPMYACVFITKFNGEYNLWKFCWEPGEHDDEDSIPFYLAWTNIDGDTWDDIEECTFDEYLILEILPTMEEVHKQFVKSMLTKMEGKKE
jgi:hypothetical protein